MTTTITFPYRKHPYRGQDMNVPIDMELFSRYFETRGFYNVHTYYSPQGWDNNNPTCRINRLISFDQVKKTMTVELTWSNQYYLSGFTVHELYEIVILETIKEGIVTSYAIIFNISDAKYYHKLLEV